MGITEEYTRINTDLDTQEEKLASLIKLLKTKAAGSGSATLETCTVTTNEMVGTIGATAYADGSIQPVVAETSGAVPSTLELENVLCGTLISISIGDSYTITASGAELVKQSSVFSTSRLYKITAGAGETATFIAVYND